MTQPRLGRRALLGGALAAAPLATARAQTPGPVRIGVLTDASGPYSDSGGPGSADAARMAVNRAVEALAAEMRRQR